MKQEGQSEIQTKLDALGTFKGVQRQGPFSIAFAFRVWPVHKTQSYCKLYQLAVHPNLGQLPMKIPSQLYIILSEFDPEISKRGFT